MKKITLILLLILMIVTLVACGDKCEHMYDHACDAICNGCEETRQIGEHQWKDATCTTLKTCTVCGMTEGESLGHTPAEDDGDCGTDVLCTVCGAVTTPARLEHVPRADDGDCTTPVTCTECAKVLTAAKSHDYTGDWEKDADGHWHVCQNENCTAEETKAAHNPNIPSATISQAKVCTECGYEMESALPHDHTYTVADYNDTHHYMRCACGQSDDGTKVAHTAEADDDNCLTARKCTGCDYIAVASKNHEAGEDDGDCTTPVKCKNCNQIAVSGNQTHAYGAITYTWADDYSSCTAMRKCTVNGCQSTETETKAATQDGAIFTVDFDNEAFETQRVDTSVQIGNVTVNPWNEAPLIDAGEAEEQYGKENEQ